MGSKEEEPKEKRDIARLEPPIALAERSKRGAYVSLNVISVLIKSGLTLSAMPEISIIGKQPEIVLPAVSITALEMFLTVL